VKVSGAVVRRLGPGGRRVLLGALLVVLAVVVAGCGGGPARSPDAAGGQVPATSRVALTSPVSSAAAPSAVDRASGLPGIAVEDLPPEARATIGLIRDGGPFPYEQDGAVFGNRERLLPPQPAGWYREYTVATPGSDDRGARRIVAGSDGTLYWTDDHYASFWLVDE
jgi:ribonuclease T1